MKKYDYIIVGSGLFGSVFAREAVDHGFTALIIEKRDHFGGNCFTYNDEETGINIHKYGTHIFHTSSEDIWRYVNRFVKFNRYQHRVLTTHAGKVYSLPVNLETINRFFDVRLRPWEAREFLKSKCENIAHPSNLEEKAMSLVGRELYEAFFKGYTIKQWNEDPRHLPAEIITRIPVRFSYYDSYFNDIYQGIPVGGYTEMFRNLLKDIPVELSVDFFQDRERWRKQGRRLVYTGPIDRYFDYCFGRLRWRSVRFEKEWHDVDDYQGTSVMNYADLDTPWTRIHEPRHLHPELKADSGKTVVMKEYSCAHDDEPYYPVRLGEDRIRATQYHELQRKEKGVIFGGRLAEFRYYDMHHVIGSALTKARKALAEEKG